MLAAFVSVFVFVAASTLAALGQLMGAAGAIDGRLSLVSLGVGAIAGAGAFFHTPKRPIFWGRRTTVWSWLILLAFALFALRAFGWLIFWHEDRIEILSPNNLGDISLHLQYARLFANGAHWWPDNPEFAWGSLRYYPGLDLFQSLLLSVGVDELHALVWVGLIAAAATALALYLWGGPFTIAGFLFSGGFAGYEILRTGRLLDYQKDLAWKNLPLAVFVTQRPFLFALPVGLLLLTHWREKFFPVKQTHAGWPGSPPEDAGPGFLPPWVEWLLYASLPLFQLYSFLFVSLILAWLFTLHGGRPGLRRHVLLLITLAFLPAAAEISLMTSAFTGGGLHMQLGWMQKDQGFFAFWLLNFGLFAPLAIGLWLWRVARTAVTQEEEEAVDAFLIPAGLIFLFACIVMLSAWEWDNTKLMLWCYLAALPFLWQKCISPLAGPLRWLLCALLFFSGGISLVGGIGPANKPLLLAKRSEIDDVRAALFGLPADARFAAAPEYNHPLVLCGRKLAMGYEGHLVSAGLDYKPVERDLRALMTGAPYWRKAAVRLEVRYLFWGPREIKRFEDSTQPWAAQCKQIAGGDWGAIYDLATPSSPGGG